MAIGKNIRLTFNLYFKNFILLFLATLVVAVLNTITILILAGPLQAGLFMLCLKLVRGQPVGFNEIFAYFKKFVPTLLVFLLFFAVLLICWVISFAFVLGQLHIWMLMLFVIVMVFSFNFHIVLGLIAERDLKVLPALKRGLEYFLTHPVLIWLYVFYYSLGIIFIFIIPTTTFLLILIHLILVALVFPFVILNMAVFYQELTAKEPATGINLVTKTLKIIGITLAALILISTLSKLLFPIPQV